MQIDITKAKQIQVMRIKIATERTMIGKMITFEGLMKGNRRAGVQTVTDMVVDVKYGRRKGNIYHTARGIRVPESLITDFSDPTPGQVPVSDVFADRARLEAQKLRQMQELVHHTVTWDSQKAGALKTGFVVRYGKRRLTVISNDSTGKWNVPLNLIRSKDGQPWSYQVPA